MSPRGLGAAALFGAVCLASTALAQPAPAINVQRFAPATNVRSFVSVEAARVLPQFKPGFALTFAYGHHPLQVSSAQLQRQQGILDGLVSMHLNAGFGLAEWAQIELSMPFLQLGIAGELGLADAQAGAVVASPGDLTIAGRLLPLRESQGVGVAVVPFVTLPTGRRVLHLTDGVPTFGAKIAASRHFRYVRLAGHFGYQLKPGFAGTATFGADDALLFGAGVGGSPLPDRLDLQVEVVGQGVVGRGVEEASEAYRALRHSPLELHGSVRIKTPVGLDVLFGGGPGLTPGVGTPAWRAMLQVSWAPPDEPADADGDGLVGKDDACLREAEDVDGFEDEDGCPDVDNDADGLLDGDDQCPDEAEDTDGFEDDDGCPDHDHDGDGIANDVDQCPDHPEDKDGDRDDDGCPDIFTDTDADGIGDERDVCPEEPEDPDGWDDVDGCPDPDNDGDAVLDADDLCPNQAGAVASSGCPEEVKAVKRGDRIVILEKVLFVSGKDIILRRSHPVLQAVTQTILDNPDAGDIQIEGHTDSDGSEAANLDLSQARAVAVMRFLVQRGVDPDRLRAVGYGESTPIADNATSDGKQRNLRVEFKIVEK